jgi:hypothetical protein
MSHTYAKLTDYDTGNCFEVDLTFKVRPGQKAQRYRDNSWEAPVPPEVDITDAEVLCFWHRSGSRIDRKWIVSHGFTLDKFALRLAIESLACGEAVYDSLVEEYLDETF